MPTDYHSLKIINWNHIKIETVLVAQIYNTHNVLLQRHCQLFRRFQFEVDALVRVDCDLHVFPGGREKSLTSNKVSN
jgi:hypothetical protein